MTVTRTGTRTVTADNRGSVNLARDAHSARLEGEPHAVYRMFDENGVALYIGCTYNVEKRLSEQRSVTPLWKRTVRTTSEWYPTRSAALAAEAAAIHDECPYWNTRGAEEVDDVARQMFADAHGRRPSVIEHFDYARQHHDELVRQVHARRSAPPQRCAYERIR